MRYRKKGVCLVCLRRRWSWWMSCDGIQLFLLWARDPPLHPSFSFFLSFSLPVLFLSLTRLLSISFFNPLILSTTLSRPFLSLLICVFPYLPSLILQYSIWLSSLTWSAEGSWLPVLKVKESGLENNTSSLSSVSVMIFSHAHTNVLACYSWKPLGWTHD